jgi:hypothetical protein
MWIGPATQRFDTTTPSFLSKPLPQGSARELPENVTNGTYTYNTMRPELSPGRMQSILGSDHCP